VCRGVLEVEVCRGVVPRGWGSHFVRRRGASRNEYPDASQLIIRPVYLLLL